MRSKRIRLTDVAVRAGVSLTTASLILRGKGVFAAETKARVRQAVADLRFVPNGHIHALQTGRANTIGVFTWSLDENPWFTISLPIVKGVAMGISAVGRDMLIYSDLPGRFENGCFSAFLDKRIDGLICAPTPQAIAAIAEIAAAGLPTVVLYHQPVPDTLGSVDIDNLGGGLAATEHLIELGHRRIAFDGLGREGFLDRLAGYRQALRRQGLPADPTLILAPSDDWMRLDIAMDRLFGLSHPPTAIFAATDSRALAWLEAAHQRGLRVPQDLSIIGFDDALAASAPPGLTTIRQPCDEIGRVAAELIVRLMDGEPGSACRIVVPVELVVRGSTGPPSAFPWVGIPRLPERVPVGRT